MGFRTGLDRCRKSRPPRGFDPRNVQPVGSRYTDYSTLGGLYTRTYVAFPLLSGIVTTVPSLASVVSNNMNYVT